MNPKILPLVASLDLAEANHISPILNGMSEEQQS